MGKEIRIIGGGLAGLTLGILLRRDEVPVQIHDAGTYPRQRVCGAFISGGGVEILSDLGIADVPTPLGSYARDVRFFDNESSSALDLPDAALAIDRAALDHSLAHAFQRAGGVLHQNSRWTEPLATEGVVRATGRRLRKTGTSGLLGIKVHARNVNLSADLELHFSDAGYVGLSRQRDGTVNVCALFRDRSRLKASAGSLRDLAEKFSAGMGSALRDHLAVAQFEPSTFAAVAGVSLRRERARGAAECRIGDSICMIPPMTGNGMSIAVESAALAAPLLRDFSLGRLSWAEAQARIAAACDKRFRRRLAAAALLQNICFQWAGRKILLSLGRKSPVFVRSWFRLTR